MLKHLIRLTGGDEWQRRKRRKKEALGWGEYIS